jgi:hypothetical protein
MGTVTLRPSELSKLSGNERPLKNKNLRRCLLGSKSQEKKKEGIVRAMSPLW